MAKIAKKTKRYPSDLTDEEWAEIAPLMPKPGRRGRPREVEFREAINAVRYITVEELDAAIALHSAGEPSCRRIGFVWSD